MAPKEEKPQTHATEIAAEIAAEAEVTAKVAAKVAVWAAEVAAEAAAKATFWAAEVAVAHTAEDAAKAATKATFWATKAEAGSKIGWNPRLAILLCEVYEAQEKSGQQEITEITPGLKALSEVVAKDLMEFIMKFTRKSSGG